MPITFHCQSCKAKMTVPDQMAGKRGKCSKCKGAIQVPGLNGTVAPAPTPAPAVAASAPAINPQGEIVRPAPPPAPPAETPEDLEAAALAALADEKKPEQEEQESAFIAFICPQCDENVKLPMENAGKKAQCPSCRRIVAVPRPAKKDPATWRDTGPNLPSGAKRDVGPAPEDAWGTGGAKVGPSIESLKQAGAIEDKRKPATLFQRSFPYLLIATPVALLLFGGLYAWYRFTQLSEKRAYQNAMAFAGTDKGAQQVGPEGIAALHAYAGEYQVRAGDGKHANEEFGKALARAKASKNDECDALMLDLLRTQTLLYTLPADTAKDKKARESDVQRQLKSTLLTIADSPARLEGLRRVVAIFVERNEADRAINLTKQVYAGSDAVDCEALAVVALELLRAGKSDLAAQAVGDALKPYPADVKAKGRPPLTAAVVAAAVALGKTPPAGAKSLRDEDAERLGKAVGLAYKGQADEARKAIGGGKDRESIQALVELAAATGEASDATAAIDALAQPGFDKDKWVALRAVEVAQRAKLGDDQLTRATGTVPGTLNAWAKLLLFRAKLASSKAVENVSLIEESLPTQSLAANVARLELARHNTKRDGGWGNKISKWEDGPRAFGSLGVALGMQGK